MRVPVFILFMAMTMGLYAQKYKVGTTTALWKVPASTDFSQARSVGVEYVEVAFNQCYRGVPADEVVPRIRDMKAKIDSAGIKVWSIHLPFSRTFVNECHWLPTQGDIQWGKLMHALEGIGYEGVFMYEATKDHENDNTRPTPERVVETFNKIINDYKNQK